MFTIIDLIGKTRDEKVFIIPSKEYASDMKLPFQTFLSITTDRTSAMAGIRNGYLGLYRKDE
jgi:hypothetical protein